MFNRYKRRPLLTVFFLLQFLLFSTYTFHYYQHGNADEDNAATADDNVPPAPDDLPASQIEGNHRPLGNHKFVKLKWNDLDSKPNPRSYERMKALNVSFVLDDDAAHTPVLCPLLPSNLVGRLEADLYSYEMSEVEAFHSNTSIHHGGHWFPRHCTARYRVAIIIPYRNRDMQLRIFLNFMHTFLQKQQLDYRIFLIEPAIDAAFNRALLFNIGFREAMKHYSWECFIFHDVDLIPEDDRNIYSCPVEPRHMSVAVNTMNYELPYRTIFGGVSALTVEQFESVNGFSNQFFGWGGEDDDMAARILTKYRISRYPTAIARYKMLRHRPDTPNQSRYRILGLSGAIRTVDGLSNLQYSVLEARAEKLFTLIRVTYNETLIKSRVAHIRRTKKNSKSKRSTASRS